MSAGFTPGPWSFHAFSNPTVRECSTLGEDFRYADYCIGSGNIMIADVRLAFGGGGGGFPTVGDEAEFTANAHLIAAAPDLFEALFELVGEELGGDVNPNNASRETNFYRPVISWAMRHRARAALAKARGETK